MRIAHALSGIENITASDADLYPTSLILDSFGYKRIYRMISPTALFLGIPVIAKIRPMVDQLNAWKNSDVKSQVIVLYKIDGGKIRFDEVSLESIRDALVTTE